MGKIKHLGNVMDFFEKSPVVNIKDIEMIVKDKKYTRLLLFNLSKRKKINQITRGFYTVHEDPVLSVFCFKPAYIGLQNALAAHDLWEQETNTVIVTVRKARIGMRRILESNAIIHRISRKYFFGYEFIKYGKFYIPVSDKEKTLIDLVQFNITPDRETLENIKKSIDKKRLKNYLSKYPKNFRNKVLGIL